ncbi:MAG: N-acetyl-alpha-D-glucosaminyl L-malate synthase BshA [Lentisphaerae bacterium]|nr:MAG: N-acetyl-alpha-D-glucosaminyl L-malate synthase BshA [Lentisphaerota bacterium]
MKLKLGIVCYPGIGGSGLVATELGLALARRGHDVHFISYAAPFRLRNMLDHVRYHSVDPIDYPLFRHSLYTFALTAKIVEILEDYDLDLIHCHYSIPHALCAHLAREITGKAVKIVTTLHGTDVSLVGIDKPLYPLNRYGIQQSDAVTTVSRFQAEFVRRHFDLDLPIQVIYNFIDPEVFRPDGEVDCCRSCLARPDEKIIMHVSNYRPPKNPEGVIRTFHKVHQRIKARLVLVGDGPGICTIRHYCREHELSDAVHFLGKHDQVERILPLADCVFLPSYREAFGMAILEAMACGVPTVTSHVDGIPEVVEEGVTGFMAAPDDHDALAEAIIRICSDDRLAREMGEAGRRRCVNQFHIDQIVPLYEALYRDILAR